MTLVGNFAVVGSSGARENKTFAGQALDDKLQTHGAEATCGLYVIDLRSDEICRTVTIGQAGR